MSLNSHTRPISILTATALGVSAIPLTPIVTVDALDTNWPYPYTVIPSDVGSGGLVSSFGVYRAQVPIYFNIPKQNSGGFNIDVISVELNGKSIQAVSFISVTGLTTIGSNAFYNNQIRELYWNNSSAYTTRNPITIGEGAFKDNLLKKVDLPDKVSVIGASAFEKNQISYIVSPNFLTEIGKNAFANNELTSKAPNGTQFKIPVNSTYEVISEGTFRNNKLTELTIPDSITKIEDYAFAENPLTSVYFENPNTTISSRAFGTPPSNLVIIGRGQKSTAKSYATSNKLKYVDIDGLTDLVSIAEKELTRESYNEAYSSVIGLADSNTQKSTYLKRLTSIELYLNAGELVEKAERELTRISYDEALTATKKMASGTQRTAYESRLAVVRSKFETAKTTAISEAVNKALEEGTLTTDILKEYQAELSTFLPTAQTQGILAVLSSNEADVDLSTFLKAKSLVSLLKESPTTRNAAETKKWLEMVKDGYAYTDSNAGVTTTKDDLVAEYKSLNKLLLAVAAVGITEKYLTEEKYEDALVLVMDLDDVEPEKVTLREKLIILDSKIDAFKQEIEIVEKLLEKAKKHLTTETINEAKNVIAALDNDYWEEHYSAELEILEYKKEILDIQEKIKVSGGTESDFARLIAVTALLPTTDTDVMKYANDFLTLRAEYDQQRKNLEELTSKIDSLDVYDIRSLNAESYAEMKEMLRDLPASFVEKADLELELNELLLKLGNLQDTEGKVAVVKSAIDDWKSGNKIAANNDYQSVWSVITGTTNPGAQKVLKDYYASAILKIGYDNIAEFEKQVTTDTYTKAQEIIQNIRNEADREEYIAKLDVALKNSIDDQMNKFDSLTPTQLDTLSQLINYINAPSVQVSLRNQFDDMLANNLKSRLKDKTKYTDAISYLAYKKELETGFPLIKDLSIKNALLKDNDTITNEVINQYITDNALSELTEEDLNVIISLISGYNDRNSINDTSNTNLQGLIKNYFIQNYSDTVNNIENDTLNTSSATDLQAALVFLSKFPSSNFSKDYIIALEDELENQINLGVTSIGSNNFQNASEINDIEQYLNNVVNKNTQEILMAALEKNTSDALESSLTQALQTVLSNGDLSQLADVIKTTQALNDSPLKNTLKEKVKQFISNNEAAIQKAMTKEKNAGNTILLQEFTNALGVNLEMPTISDASNEEALIKEINDLKDSVKSLEALKALLALLNTLDSNKTQSEVGNLSSISIDSVLSQLAELNEKNAILNAFITSNNITITNLSAEIASITAALELNEASLKSSNMEITDLNAMIEDLNAQVNILKNKMEQMNRENTETTTPIIQTLEESNVALQAELVSQKNDKKKLKRGVSASLIIIMLMASYGIVSARRSRKLLEKSNQTALEYQEIVDELKKKTEQLESLQSSENNQAK